MSLAPPRLPTLALIFALASSSVGCKHAGLASDILSATAQVAATALVAAAVARGSSSDTTSAEPPSPPPAVAIPIDVRDCGEGGVATARITYGNDGHATAVVVVDTRDALDEATELCVRGRYYEAEIEPFSGPARTFDVEIRIGEPVEAALAKGQPGRALSPARFPPR